jgi:chromosome segregation ATPase
MKHYASDQDAGHEEPWAWGAERNLYSRQLQDANKRIHELEQELLKLREEKKAREQAIKSPSDPTVSVLLSEYNKLCAQACISSSLEAENIKLHENLRKIMHAAAHPPTIEDEPEAFPARALRFSA